MMKLLHIQIQLVLPLLDVLEVQVQQLQLHIVIIQEFIKHQLQEIHLSQELQENVLEYSVFQIQTFLETLHLKLGKEYLD